MEEDFQAHHSRFPRLQSDDCRRRAMSGAAIGGEPRHQAFTRGSALMNDVVIEPRQPLHIIPESFQRPQLPAYPPAQYDWQDPRGRQVPPGYPVYQSHGQVPPGYPVPLYQSHERYLPDTHGNYTMDHRGSHVPFHPVNTQGHAPHTPISDPRNFSYDPGYGPDHNYYPSSNGNSSGAGHPYLAFEDITATRAWGSEPGPPHLMPQRRITESPAIEEGPRRDLCSSPYFGNTSASSSPVEPRRSNMGAPRNNPRTPRNQIVHPSPCIASSSSSYHQDRGEEQGSDLGTSVPRARYSSRTQLKKAEGTRRKPAAPSFYTQSPVSMVSSPANSQQDIPKSTSYPSSDSLYDRNTKSRAMSTRSTLLTPVLSDSDSDSDAEESSLQKKHRIVASSLITTPQRESAVQTSAPTVSSEERDHVICAVSESRSAEVVGIAVINITTGQVDLARVLNDDKYMYQRLGDTLWKMPSKPEKFLVVNSVTNNNSKSLLISCLEQDFPAVPIVLWGREHWSEAEGLRMIERFALRDRVIALKSDLENNFYVSCAFSAAMKYVQNELNIHFASNALRVRYIQPLNTMGIDRTTVASLELLQNTRRATAKKSTLFGILNSTQTPQGHRLLRTTLLQPSTDKEEIEERYESVEELSTNEELFRELRKALKGLDRIDFERVIVWLNQEQPRPRQPLEEGVPGSTNQGLLLPTHAELAKAEQELNYILMLKAYLRGIDALHSIIEAAACKSRLLRWAKNKFAPEHTEPIQSAMEEMIENDAAYSKTPIDLRNNRMWAVRAGRNAVLEQARRSFKDLTDDLNGYFDMLNNQFNGLLGNGADLCMDSNRRYWLKFDYSDVARELQNNQSDVQKRKFGKVSQWKQVSIANIDIINGTRDKKHFKCQTTELLQRSRAIQLQADIATMQSDNMVIELKERLQQHSSLMFDISDAVALLDMLCSFTQAATTQDYVRPMITDSMVLKQARNPIVEVRKSDYVANDVYSGDQSGRFQVITGGNMSGKSTFIRSVALIQIMAQMGSFVPADFGSISICDRVFSRVSTDDAPENNLGTFGVEMRETNVILRQATTKSMIIMDELGRGTSVKDGLAIAIAVSEKLIKMKSRVFFATHFTGLARLLNAPSYQRDVLNVHFRGQNEILLPRIKLPHTLAGGPVKTEDYGIKLARIVLPLPAVYKAEEVLRVLQEMQRPPQSGEKTREARQNKVLLALPGVLREALNSSMDDAALVSYLQRLKTEFTLRMSEVTDVIHDLIEGGRKRPAEDDAEAESGADEGREKRRREE